MCGIAGIVSLDGRELTGGKEHVSRMIRMLEHRGPDDAGIWCSVENQVVLGHRRLSILDLSAAGHQPMAGKRGATVVFNGEIYNYRSLKTRCGSEPFVSGSDTEVLVRLYEELGER